MIKYACCFINNAWINMSKITEKKDFDFICSLMESFFEQELITERLRFIQEKRILSWESWW